MGWQAISAQQIQQMSPSLVEQLPSGEEGRWFAFTSDELKLGSDSKACSLVIENDPFVSKVHAVVTRSSNGQWGIRDAKSTNGIWMRVASLPLDTHCEFQLGEQRFVFHPT